MGAGPVGLTLANELARHEVDFRIIDKAPHASTTSKALAIHARTLEVLQDMGMVETFIGHGVRVHTVNLYSQQKPLAKVDITEVDSPYNYILNVPQDVTEAILAENLATYGFEVERNCELQSFSQDEGGVEAHLQNPEGKLKVRAKYLVGTDGGHSTVRKRLGMPFEGDAYDEHFILADVHINWALAPNEMHLFLDKAGLFLFFPMKGKRYRIVASIPEETEGKLDIPYFQRLIEERKMPQAELYDAVWFSHFKIHHRKVPRYRDGHVFLAGDAAHVHSPMGGQGMNTGMQDAYNLGWKLALAVNDKADLLDSYHDEREPVGHDVVSFTDRMTNLATLKHPLATAVRDRVMPILAELDFFKSRMRNKMEEIDIDYADSGIIAEEITATLPASIRNPFYDGVPLGMRAPDGIVTECSNGKPHSLYELFRTTEHILLIFTFAYLNGEHTEQIRHCLDLVEMEYADMITPVIVSGRQKPEEAIEREDITYLDPRRSVHERYGVHKTSALFLIRPDKYVGFRSLPVNARALEIYLRGLYHS